MMYMLSTYSGDDDFGGDDGFGGVDDFGDDDFGGGDFGGDDGFVDYFSDTICSLFNLFHSILDR